MYATELPVPLHCDELPQLERPTWQEIRDHWAFSPNVIAPGEELLALPSHRVYGLVPQPASGVPIWVDPLEHRLWLSIPLDAWCWKTREQLEDWRVLNHQVIPDWLKAADPNVPRASGIREFPLLLARRDLTPEQSAALLDAILPAEGDYPLPAPLARIFRAGGWAPRQVQHLSWRVEREQDARALANRLPRWWAGRNWPLYRYDRAERLEDALAARVIPRLLDAGVRGDVLDYCLGQGVTSPERIIALRPPRVPDDAARVIVRKPRPYGHSVLVGADAARAYLERYPYCWLLDDDEVACTAGVHPLHISDRWSDPADLAFLSVWSDGLLVGGHVAAPASVGSGQAERDWMGQYRAFAATRELLHLILAAREREEANGNGGQALSAAVWMPWQDATGVDTDVIESVAAARNLDKTISAERTLTVLRDTVHCADGSDRHVYRLRVRLVVRGRLGEKPISGAHLVFTDQDAAQAAMAARAAQPVLVSVAQGAHLLGVSRDALAQGLSRAARAGQADGRRAWWRPLVVYRTGGTTWYDPQRLIDFWARRPGHGPGRGHTAG